MTSSENCEKCGNYLRPTGAATNGKLVYNAPCQVCKLRDKVAEQQDEIQQLKAKMRNWKNRIGDVFRGLEKETLQ